MNKFSAGEKVKTPFGVGCVESVRTDDGMYLVVLVNWKLATGKSPVLYVPGDGLEPFTFVEVKDTPVVAEVAVAPAVVAAPAREDNEIVVGDAVKTPYGRGIVKDVRGACIVVIPSFWSMAGGQKPTFYMHRNEVSPVFKVGDVVATQYGEATIQTIRNDAMYVATTTAWKLATSKPPVLHLGAETLMLSNPPVPPAIDPTPALLYVPTRKPTVISVSTGDVVLTSTETKEGVMVDSCPALFVGACVSTPYGKGVIRAIRDTCIVVIPSYWTMAGGQKPTFFLNPADVFPLYKPGDVLATQFGEAVIQSVREDGMYIAVTTNWKLATGKSPVLFLNGETIMATSGASSSSAATTAPSTEPAVNNSAASAAATGAKAPADGKADKKGCLLL